MKGIIYYTDFHADPLIMDTCLEQLKKSFTGEVVSATLKKPLDFGKNIVVNMERSYSAMIFQILTALENSTADYVFFCESDVLYHPSHFDFEPTRKDIYYYNVNNWRWRWGTDVAINYDYLISLSGLCCDRELAIKHYKLRMEALNEHTDTDREPHWVRKMGYEPGTKLIKRGGITDEGHEKWWSKYPNVDIRHKGTFSHPKTHLEEFKHKPTDTWREKNIKDIEGWDLKGLFK